VQRIFGQDAIATSAAVSRTQFPESGSAAAVVLARSDYFADALAGGPLAAAHDGPLLITPGAALASALDSRVAAEIQRVLPTGHTIYVLGGQLALAPGIDTALQNLGFVVLRVHGANQFATATAIAGQLGNPSTVFEATGLDFADALSSVPATIQAHGAILLTNGSAQAPETAAYLDAHSPATRYAIGGPLAAAGADPSAVAVYGQNLFETSAAVASRFFPGAKTFGAATGLNFPDALSGGVFMGTSGRVGALLLVNPSAPLPSSITAYLVSNTSLAKGYLFGGPLAVGDDVLAALQDPLQPLPAPPPIVPVPTGSPTLSIFKAVVTGLDHPWDVAFVDTSMMLYTERPGRISSLAGGVSKLVGTVGDVTTSGEDGLMGIAVDPAFATNHFVYVCVSTTANDNRVRRYTVDLSAAANAGLSGPLDLVGSIPHANFHDGCRVRFQPGTSPLALWVTTGDAGQGPTPQSDSGLGGKVLRITTTGTAYPGNASARQWYTKGHRNPQGLAFRPGSNDPYAGEHGPTVNDEVNKLVNGGNAGWDPNTGGTYDQSRPMTDLEKFPGAMRPVWRSGDGGTIAPSGITFLSGSQWKTWDGALIMAVLKKMELRVLLMNPDGGVSGQFQVPGSTGTRLRSVVQGPDGNLYVATDGRGTGGAIWKITPS